MNFFKFDIHKEKEFVRKFYNVLIELKKNIDEINI